MRFTVLIRGDPPPDMTAGNPKFSRFFEAMHEFEDDLTKAGVKLASEGLQPSWTGTRIRFGSDGTRTVVNGPFHEAEEPIAGFFILDVKSRDEAIEWAKRCPIDLALDEGQTFEAIEIREIADAPPV
jgi:hypothetical protein